MTQLATLLHSKRTPLRVHKPLPKPVNFLSPLKDSTQLSQSQPLRTSYSPSRIRQKKQKPKVGKQFNLCTSKNVFVFARKQVPVKLDRLPKPTETCRGQTSQELFCARDKIKRPLYRTVVRSHSCKRQKSQDLSQRKISTSQTNMTFLTLNPQPWEMERDAHEFETLM